MRNFSSLTGDESILQILQKISESKEFAEVVVRTGEKKMLNSLNSGKGSLVRFRLEGKVKTPAMKVNLLIQVTRQFEKRRRNIQKARYQGFPQLMRQLRVPHRKGWEKITIILPLCCRFCMHRMFLLLLPEIINKDS